MDIVRFVVHHADKLNASVHSQHVNNVMNHQPVTIDQKGTSLCAVTPDLTFGAVKVSAALELCAKHRYSGIGIVDAAGHLVGNFSISDLRVCIHLCVPLRLTCTHSLSVQATCQRSCS